MAGATSDLPGKAAVVSCAPASVLGTATPAVSVSAACAVPAVAATATRAETRTRGRR